MAGVTAHGGTFTFINVTATITSISVETPQAEVVDMTSTSVTAMDQTILVPTGAWSGGMVTVDYIHGSGLTNVRSLVRSAGKLTFAPRANAGAAPFSVTRNAILESATVNAGVGDIVRGTMKFRLTDYTVQTTWYTQTSDPPF